MQGLSFTFVHAVILLSAGVSSLLLPRSEIFFFAYHGSEVIRRPATSADDPIKDADLLLKDINKSVAASSEAILRSTNLKADLEKVKEIKKADEVSVRALQNLSGKLKNPGDGVTPTLSGLADSISAIGSYEKQVDPLVVRLKALPSTPEIEEKVKSLNTAKKTAADKIADLNKSKDSLTDSSSAALKSIESVVADLMRQLGEANNQSSVADDLTDSLPSLLPSLTAIYTLHQDLAATGPELVTELKKIVQTSAASPNLAGMTALMGSTTDKVGSWAEILTDDTVAMNKTLLAMREQLDANFKLHHIAAMKLMDEAEPKGRNLANIVPLGLILARAAASKSVEAKLQELEKVVQTNVSRLEFVRSGLSGDFKNFVNDFVSLYYFTDIPNLMRVLNKETMAIKDVSALREEAAAKRRKVDRADLDLSAASALVSSLQVRKRNLINYLKDAENDFQSSTGLLAQAERRLSRFSEDDPARRASKERVDDLTVQKAADEKRYNELKDENNGLPAQIRAADAKLSVAQQTVQQVRSDLIMHVQDESLAFAQARDNEPVYFAPNDVMSKDPIKQVIIYAFGNRKILYLRGTKGNVERAKNIISFFDRPAPQARLALWTLELNGLPTKKGSQQFTDSLLQLDNRLSNTRALIAASQSFLRRCINEEVEVAAHEARQKLKTTTTNSGEAADVIRWSRSFFYEDEVLLRLGFDKSHPVTVTTKTTRQNEQAKIVAWQMLPDPIGAGSLGEALVILSLAKDRHRTNILRRFSKEVNTEIAKVVVPLSRDGSRQRVAQRATLSFEMTKLALGMNGASPYTPIQKEIVNSITLASIPRLFRRLEQLKNASEKVEAVEKGKTGNLHNEIRNVIEFLWYGYGVSTTDLFGRDMSSEKGAELIVEDFTLRDKSKRILPGLVERLDKIKEEQNVFRLANAQIAKTDNLVKQLIDAYDEDINRSIVQPTIYGLRQDLVSDKVSVGIISRTSILATNRLVARVDARGSAQLTVGEEKDALLAVQQLANLYMAAKTGGILGGLGGLKSIRSERDTSEVYGINSGSVFKVTPVFDPSGQALRFQFDHTLANMVTEPDGSVQAAMPRVERHTVNTEVQLSNMELREISRFESNARLGIPTSYKGGVPIFRDIPYVNKIPLLGWFVRRSGQSAVIQESIILGQTTMYPTIADIFDLLSGDDYNYESKKANEQTY